MKRKYSDTLEKENIFCTNSSLNEWTTIQYFGRLGLIKRHGRDRLFLTMMTSWDFKRIEKKIFLQVKISLSQILFSKSILHNHIQRVPRSQGKVSGTVLYYQWEYLQYHTPHPILSQRPMDPTKTPNVLLNTYPKRRADPGPEKG